MNDLSLIISKNIVELRKQHGLTQLNLAEKLNYSDKAVSKWERGESIPDVSVLMQIAELFSVTLDYLVTEEHKESPKKEEVCKREEAQKIIYRNRRAIMGICIQAVWLIATMFFVLFSLIGMPNDTRWLGCIYAIPISSIVWLVFNSIWFNRRKNYLIISILMWSVLAAIHITALLFGVQLNIIYLFGLPGEIIIILWSIIAKKPTK